MKLLQKKYPQQYQVWFVGTHLVQDLINLNVVIILCPDLDATLCVSEVKFCTVIFGFAVFAYVLCCMRRT